MNEEPRSGLSAEQPQGTRHAHPRPPRIAFFLNREKAESTEK